MLEASGHRRPRVQELQSMLTGHIIVHASRKYIADYAYKPPLTHLSWQEKPRIQNHVNIMQYLVAIRNQEILNSPEKDSLLFTYLFGIHTVIQVQTYLSPASDLFRPKRKKCEMTSDLHSRR